MIIFRLIAVLAILASVTLASAQSNVQLVYSFQCAPDAEQPVSVSIASNGNLYGASITGGTENKGTVFELKPPAVLGSPWTERVIHSFAGGSDGQLPTESLTIGPKGALFGTAMGGLANSGVVFEMIPPSVVGGQWTEQIIYSFGGGLDGNAASNVVLGKDGLLYGFGGGGVNNTGFLYRLQPSANAGEWQKSILYSLTAQDPIPFGNPISMGSSGEIIGSAEALFNGNVVISNGSISIFTPSSTSNAHWNEFVYKFSGGLEGGGPRGAITAGPVGVLFGTGIVGGAYGAGVTYELIPPSASGGTWVYKKIADFPGGERSPTGSLLIGSSGILFGTTAYGGNYGIGTVFALLPPTVGSSEWQGTDLGELDYVQGVYPVSGLAFVPPNLFYGAAADGGGSNCGTIFSAPYKPAVGSH